MRSHKKAVLESRNEASSLDAQHTYAYWPPRNSTDERNVRSLIKRCSEPNVETWIKLVGRLRGVYDSLAEAEEALDMLSGETAIESEAERLAAVGEAAARKNNASLKSLKKTAKMPATPTVTSGQSTVTCVGATDTSVPSIVQPPERLVSESTMTSQPIEAQSDARRKLADLCARKYTMPSVPRLDGQQIRDHSGNVSMGADDVMDALKVINSNITAYMVS